jgi:hypothetical protein
VNGVAGPWVLPPPEFHASTDALRFWVRTSDRSSVGASVSRLVLHYRFKGLQDGSDAAAVYAANRALIDAAVLRRLSSGSLEPVMLREHDLSVPAHRP